MLLLVVAIERSRELLGSELSALVGESYERAYGDMVRVQQLTELEEVIRYQQSFAGMSSKLVRLYYTCVYHLHYFSQPFL